MSTPLSRLEATLHEQIPLSRAMGLRVATCDAEGLVLEAPLTPNRNHTASAFAGSLNSLLTLAGWGLVWLLLDEAQVAASVVIQDSTISYRRPVTEPTLVARCSTPAVSTRTSFLSTLRKRGLARISLVASIGTTSDPAVHFNGRFVASIKGQGRAAEHYVSSE